jgi:hypothetical protein
MERDAERLEEQSDRVERHIDETRSDWEGKESDTSVPGAQPDLDEEGEGVAGAESEPEAETEPEAESEPEELREEPGR